MHLTAMGIFRGFSPVCSCPPASPERITRTAAAPSRPLSKNKQARPPVRQDWRRMQSFVYQPLKLRLMSAEALSADIQSGAIILPVILDTVVNFRKNVTLNPLKSRVRRGAVDLLLGDETVAQHHADVL